ncbi:hypothetical protein RIF25_12845 [Thermosynechococcaceae cyanobacterium BACA0444]|uniref:Lipoprotein n=1 Tax=Pseudocalidococcus azoricus BACA0444 TaxID=2918990 RepID=A0AAE4JWR8_9CYAN|nr:hypothetical protein [Pseudocalidococcus azoricus]MDS3861690.1 hypothetical protein [Pseudocalidococcus azoricus BACA0444]
MVSWKPIVLSVALAGLGCVTPAILSPQFFDAQVLAQTKITPSRALTVIVVNNSGVPVVAGEGNAKNNTLTPGKSKSFSFPPIKNYVNDVNILIYNSGGTPLTFSTASFNTRTNTLTINIAATKANNPNVHGSVSIGPSGTVRFI